MISSTKQNIQVIKYLMSSYGIANLLSPSYEVNIKLSTLGKTAIFWLTTFIIKPLYIYVFRIGPISGHMTLTIATFPSTTPKIHRAR